MERDQAGSHGVHAAKELMRVPEDAPHERESKKKNAELVTGEGRIGDETMTAAEMLSMGSLVAARHLMVLLAKLRRDRPREDVLRHVGDLLIQINRPPIVRKLLLEMTDAGRIVDIYPLEVLAYVLERRADLLDDIAFGRVILNREEIESSVFPVDATIVVKVPLSLKMRQFALEAAGAPGYWFAPGPPGEYHLEVGESGTFRVIVRGDIRKKSLVDRVVLTVEDQPDEA
jgi:hypothetical protein